MSGLALRESVECWLIGESAAGGRRVLLMRTAPHSVGAWPQFWQAVTGGMEDGETAVEACRREVREETGIDLPAACIEPLGLTLDIPVPEAGWLIRKRVFLARIPEQPVTLSPEHTDARWVPLADVEPMLYWGTCRTAFARVSDRLALSG